MKTLFADDDRREILERLVRLGPQSRATWGSMTPSEVVCHVGDALRGALGELDMDPPVGAFRFWPLNWLLIYLIPWPKGKAEAPPSLLQSRPAEWQRDLDGLKELIERFGKRSPDDDWPVNVAFGRISGGAWGVLQYKHCDHHLRQFGL